MANLISEPSFENDGNWVAVNVAGIGTEGEIGVAPRTGLRSAFAITSGSLGSAGKIRHPISLVAGNEYQVTGYFKRASGSNGFRAQLGDNTWDQAPGGDWTLFDESFTAATTEAVNLDLFGLLSTSYQFDDWQVVETEVVVAVTKAIKDALVLDLQDITTGNGFSMTVSEVGTRPKVADDVNFPAIFIISGPGNRPSIMHGESRSSQLGNRERMAKQEIVLQLMVDQTNGEDAIDDLLDDVANTVERDASNVKGINETNYKVWRVTMSDWDSVVTSEDVSDNRFFRHVLVTVEYYYVSGSK